jgi:hypothetical protein
MTLERNYRDQVDSRIFLGWIANHIANVMLAAEAFARAAGAADAEYGIEVELSSYATGDTPRIPVCDFSYPTQALGTLEGPILLPRISFGDKTVALNIVSQDLLEQINLSPPGQHKK